MPFSYQLEPERIAQRPVSPPDAARLLVVERGSGQLKDSAFSSLPDFLGAGDIVVFNNTRVIPARIRAVLNEGKSSCELLLVEEVKNEKGSVSWSCMGRPLKKLTRGKELFITGDLKAVVGERSADDRIVVEFISGSGRSASELLVEAGSMPIPPYIRKGEADESDRTDYQTVFAQEEGSIAAPTASLHFTEVLGQRLKERGCELHYLTMHLGPASFLPVAREGDIKRAPGRERLIFDPQFFSFLKDKKRRDGKIVAVGTSVVRALESMHMFEQQGATGEVFTDLFIEPGHNFQIVDKVITNFHQPGTTHLLLVEALLGEQMLRRCYQHALESEYRFLSYGDGMLII